MSPDWLTLILIVCLSILPIAYADPGDLCFEQLENGFCGFFDDPFGALLTPLDSIIPGFAIIMVWGAIIGILWFKTEDPNLVTIVGIIVAVTVSGLSSDALGIGMMLVAVSLGLRIFILVRHRISIFS